MRWTKAAEEAVSRVPFFVRRRVKKRVEEEAQSVGSDEVTLDHVKSCQRRFLDNMDAEVKGYQVETCFGPGGCPNRAVKSPDLAKRLEDLPALRNIREFLKGRVKGPLKLHHEFRISVSDCPNACSRPQIADVGIIGAVRPRVIAENCTECGACVDACREEVIRACVDACREEAIRLSDAAVGPILAADRCVLCGRCIAVCPSNALERGEEGYRIQLGGKLGRHPQLALEIPGIFSEEEVLRVVNLCLDHFMSHNKEGERFREIINRTGLDFLAAELHRAGRV
jgi:anaerobic sulfite reductase subunit C